MSRTAGFTPMYLPLPQPTSATTAPAFKLRRYASTTGHGYGSVRPVPEARTYCTKSAAPRSRQTRWRREANLVPRVAEVVRDLLIDAMDVLQLKAGRVCLGRRHHSLHAVHPASYPTPSRGNVGSREAVPARYGLVGVSGRSLSADVPRMSRPTNTSRQILV